MFEKIKIHLLKREIARQSRISKFRSWNDINSILILFESDPQEKNAGVKNMIAKLQEEGKRVVSCCFVDKKKAIAATLDSYVVLSREEIGYWGKPKINAIAGLLDNEFDMVMDLSTREIIPLKYVLALAKTKFRCGKNMGENELHDFVIEMPDDSASQSNALKSLENNEAKILGEQIIKYLKQVKSV